MSINTNVIKNVVHRFLLYLNPFDTWLSVFASEHPIYLSCFPNINYCESEHLQIPVLNSNFNTAFICPSEIFPLISFWICIALLKKSFCSERTVLSWYICILITFIAYKMLALWLLTPWITTFKSKALERNMNHISDYSISVSQWKADWFMPRSPWIQSMSFI